MSKPGAVNMGQVKMVWVEISYSGIWHIHFLLPCCNIQNIVHSAANQHLHQQTSRKFQSNAASVFEEGEIPIWEIYHVLFVISILLLPDPLRFLNQAKFHNWNLWPVSRKMNLLQKWQKRPFLGLATNGPAKPSLLIFLIFTFVIAFAMYCI